MGVIKKRVFRKRIRSQRGSAEVKVRFWKLQLLTARARTVHAFHFRRRHVRGQHSGLKSADWEVRISLHKKNVPAGICGHIMSFDCIHRTLRRVAWLQMLSATSFIVSGLRLRFATTFVAALERQSAKGS